MANEVFVVGAVRTPIGSFGGQLSSYKASDLGSFAIKEALNRATIPAEDVSEVIMGQALTSLEGQNPARQAACGAGLPYTVPAFTVNVVCGSGMKAVMLGAQAIQAGASSVVVCGGQESMSRAPHAMQMRTGFKFGHATIIDTAIHDGLTDAFHQYHMGITAENLATQNSITRQQQDEYAVESQRRTKVAKASGKMQAEIVPVPLQVDRKKTKDDNPITMMDQDEFPKPDTVLPSLARLRPAFKNDGTVTAGNSSGLNDGAAALVLVSGSEMEKRSLKALARLVSFAQIGLDPSVMGLGPVEAVQSALKKAGWSLDSVDLFELNEAFAAQSLAVMAHLGVPADKCNVNGGAIALGHPIGASGARILVTLLYAMMDRNVRRGVASLCIGGGMGVAMCLERV